MFELPECVTLARQMNETLRGKVVQAGAIGGLRHKFVWYNRAPGEFAALVGGKRVGAARAQGKWLLVDLEPGYVLVFGECGGRLLYHAAAADGPKACHLALTFTDGSALSVTTQMWGAMELYAAGEERQRQYLRDMRPTPVDPEFTAAYLSALMDERLRGPKLSAKGLLTQEQLIPGLGNALAQDILFRARLHPKHPLEELSKTQRRQLHRAIVQTVKAAIARGGRNDEVDLFNRPGGYARLMDKHAAGGPCPDCGTLVEKLQYLGGACYFCPVCQV